MRAIPAIDLREGACVQLVGGSYDAERVRVDDPLDALRHWRGFGFRSFHVVDLDAALGRGSNARVVTRGWTAGSGRTLDQVLAVLEPLALGGLLVTAVHKEGQLEGVDLSLMREVVERTRHRLYASGGVTTMDDLRALASAGAYGAVIGMALYTGRLDAREVAREFAE
ncbi:HisA/HisF-related TIM barrel protein [Myxococcus sp. AB025B]|uniref:1-(5-phosphoribosyl)-5-[(5- phosphoribosylamino)methylideneamino]imidazole-4- carboxamide isomerase n=1 Tax=Myxococcus sp. AB025B TaxID=2562794 RepID=UPI001142BD3A|nr:HisA/HisF-related TIM barrel protein [Myxococcus sp. AB025B]